MEGRPASHAGRPLLQATGVLSGVVVPVLHQSVRRTRRPSHFSARGGGTAQSFLLFSDGRSALFARQGASQQVSNCVPMYLDLVHLHPEETTGRPFDVQDREAGDDLVVCVLGESFGARATELVDVSA